MSNQNKYLTNDLKLQAFLRLMTPTSFIGVNKTNPNRVTFEFKHSPELLELVRGYFSGKMFEMSPLDFGNHIDQGKDLIYGNVQYI